MKKVGFIVKNTKRVNGKEYEYFYLRRSDRLKDKMQGRKKKETNLYNFGNRNKTLELLNSWDENSKNLPLELVDLGYNSEDVKKWIEEVMNR